MSSPMLDMEEMADSGEEIRTQILVCVHANVPIITVKVLWRKRTQRKKQEYEQPTCA